MAIVVDSFNEKSYSLVINSADKISGTNNNATYQVNWDDFLPRDISNYKVVYSFQTSGGYYCDGITKLPTTTAGGASLGYSNTTYGSSTNSAAIAVGATSFVLGAAYSGSSLTNAKILEALYVFVLSNINTNLNCYPIGTTLLTTSTVGASSTIVLSAGALYPIPSGSSVYFVSSLNVSPVTYSAARLLLNFNSKSSSFDTSNKGQSINLGICQRDIQTTTSKSNILSTFYCQCPPRCIARPIINLITVQVLNNCVFAGGITNYNGTTPATYSIVNTNNNFLTDTNSLGSAISSTNDMTPYILYLEFIPLK